MEAQQTCSCQTPGDRAVQRKCPARWHSPFNTIIISNPRLQCFDQFIEKPDGGNMAEKKPAQPSEQYTGNSAHSPRSTRGATEHSSGSYSFRNSYTGMPRSTRKASSGEKRGTSSARLKKNGKPKMRLWKKFLIAIALIFATGQPSWALLTQLLRYPAGSCRARTENYRTIATAPRRLAVSQGRTAEIISCKALPD